MSRRQIPALNPRYEVWAGWDPPLQTYFVQVYDKEGVEDQQPFVWLGADGTTIEFSTLARALAPYAKLSLDIARLLTEDRREDR